MLTDEDASNLAEILGSSDEDDLCEVDQRSPIQELPAGRPSLQSWVVAKIEVQQRTSKGRVTGNFKCFVGQVSTDYNAR